MIFRDPYYLFLLLLLFPYGWFLFKGRHKRSAPIGFSSISIYQTIGHSWKQRLEVLPDILRLLACIFFIVSLARPALSEKNIIIKSEGIEIIVCLDISASMKAMDLHPNRLEVAKLQIANFIKKRTQDKIGLVIFGTEAFLQCPLTLDHKIVQQLLMLTDFSEDVGHATAIGMSLATGINALKNSKAKTKIIVLLTDGVNNAGSIDPITAAYLCETYQIKAYTIGIGKPGVSTVHIKTNIPPFGMRTIPVESRMDEETLKKIASITKGNYFNVQDDQGLVKAYTSIDKLEKTKIASEKYVSYDEKFAFFILIGLCGLILEWFFKFTFFKKIP